MLTAWIVLALGQLSTSNLPMVSLTSASTQSTGNLPVPGEPSTLVEALIGIGIIACYLMLSRRFRDRRGAPTTSTPVKSTGRRKAA